MTRKHPSLRVKILRQLRPWHRRIGLFSTLLVIFIAVTGVLINHSNHLSLDSTQVKQAWLLDYYGIKAPTDVALYQTSPQTLLSTTNQLWLNDKLALEASEPILAAIAHKEMIVAIDSQHLYLLSAQGELFETQSLATGLPKDIEAIGQTDELWLKTATGLYLADSDLIEWTAAQPYAAIDWVKPIESPETAEFTQQMRASHLTWERVLLDLHSGRFFGSLGPWLMDLVALSLLIMAFTGVYIWLQQKPPRKKKTGLKEGPRS
ncbi:PepSY-associated TM helix domain-containing protein [Shewanella pealeana]|uniref:PepSY-associated TM helix domain protein n=1 Tax=Shewanella pealeana (strain ATCC 700345 / ANG-SQ1) TaxID=398579 RepID=A8H0E9_SHEPA|nr:PepSY-associated TM helix domain-containing protein [Shewanella pealeana]ABV86036.1 PepSY-associated TM helix domain protein [Shewanella pealeana ATCC 700345]